MGISCRHYRTRRLRSSSLFLELVLSLPDEFCPKWVGWDVADECTENLQPWGYLSAVERRSIWDRMTDHLAFSSSVSAKNIISSSFGNIRRNDLSTPPRPSYSSTYRLLLAVAPEAGVRTSGWSSSTAMAFLSPIVAVAFFVTSLKATRFAPITRNCRRRHV